MAGGEIELIKLIKQFAEVTAVDGIDLHMPGGEFFSLLGPSGCGKTTTLRMIAGFEQPTEGEILLDGDDMAYTPPHQRNVNTVFQNYALFPHLNVYDNVAFGLQPPKTAESTRSRRASARRSSWSSCRLREAQAGPALGRPAAARCAGPRARAEPGRAPAGRAAGRARREAPQAAADRAEVAPAAGRHHVPLRDARPGGGADDERPDRRHDDGGSSRSAPPQEVYEEPRPRSSPTSWASRT